MNKEALIDADREVFKYHVPGWIRIERIIEFIEWGEKYTATADEIDQIIEQLLRERFIVKCLNGWQIASAAK